MRTLGPYSKSLQGEGVFIHLFKPVQVGRVIIPDAPKPGQEWNISNVFFRFPNASKQNKGTEVVEFKMTVQLLIGGFIVAEQIILEAERVKTGEENPFNCVGSLEPYIPAVVHPNDPVEIVYTPSRNNENSVINSGTGFFVVTHTLILP